MPKQPYRDLIVEDVIPLFTALGSNAAQLRDISETNTLTDSLEMRKGSVVITATGDALDSAEGREWLRKNKPHLLPPESQPDEVADAFTVFNMTKRQALVQKLGLAEANRLAASYGLNDIFDRKAAKAPGDAGDKSKSAGNPWKDPDPIRREKRIVSFIAGNSAASSASMARLAGTDLAGRPLKGRAA